MEKYLTEQTIKKSELHKSQQKLANLMEQNPAPTKYRGEKVHHFENTSDLESSPLRRENAFKTKLQVKNKRYPVKTLAKIG